MAGPREATEELRRWRGWRCKWLECLLDLAGSISGCGLMVVQFDEQVLLLSEVTLTASRNLESNNGSQATASGESFLVNALKYTSVAVR